MGKESKIGFLNCRRQLLLLATCAGISIPAANAQFSDEAGSVQRPYRSIREQLEGRVEDSYKSDDSKTQTGQLDKYSGLNGQVNDDAGRFHANLGDGFSKLKGKIEQRDLMGHMNRPFDGDPLGKSVKVLSGSNYNAPVQGKAEDDSLDSVLNASNFSLPLQRMTPKSDYNALSSTQGDLRSGRGYGQPSYTWGAGDWGIGGWAVDGWGIGEGDRYAWGVYGWDSRFPGRMQQNDWGWDTLSYNQQRLRADLRADPNFYQRPFRSNSKIPSIAPLNTNVGWGISPMDRPQPAYADQNILWDQWYRKVSDALYRNWNGRGQDPGLATLRITVRRNRTIQAQILKCNNPSERFKKNLLDAVASLNGSTVLDYPSMSQREIVSFNSEFNASTDTARGAFSERRGEIETVRTRPK